MLSHNDRAMIDMPYKQSAFSLYIVNYMYVNSEHVFYPSCYMFTNPPSKLFISISNLKKNSRPWGNINLRWTHFRSSSHFTKKSMFAFSSDTCIVVLFISFYYFIKFDINRRPRTDKILNQYYITVYNLDI